MSTAQNSCGLPAGRQADWSRLVPRCDMTQLTVSRRHESQRITPQRNATGSRALVLFLGTVLIVPLRGMTPHGTTRCLTTPSVATHHNEKTGGIMLPVT